MPPRYDESTIRPPQKARYLDANIYKLATTLIMMFNRLSEFKNLSDCSIDNFINIVNNYSNVEYITFEDYREEVLEWAFASCGRRGYDKIVELFSNQED